MHNANNAIDDARGKLDCLALEIGDDFGLQRMRRERAGRVARMHAGFLDVLHHAADQDIAVLVGNDVDVHLHLAGEDILHPEIGTVAQETGTVGLDPLARHEAQRRRCGIDAVTTGSCASPA